MHLKTPLQSVKDKDDSAPNIEILGKVKIAKLEIQKQKASNWRNKQLYNQNKDLRRIGNVQEVPSPSATRKIKSEQLRSLDRDKENFIDLYKMRLDKSWNSYIYTKNFHSPESLSVYKNTIGNIAHK